MTALIRLDPADIDAIAERVSRSCAGRLPRRPRGSSTRPTLGAILGVDRAWVYAHANELHAVRLGGPRGRLRFDLDARPALARRGTRGRGAEPDADAARS